MQATLISNLRNLFFHHAHSQGDQQKPESLTARFLAAERAVIEEAKKVWQFMMAQREMFRLHHEQQLQTDAKAAAIREKAKEMADDEDDDLDLLEISTRERIVSLDLAP